MLYGLFNHIATVSNRNLIRNVDYLSVHDKRDNASMEWSVGGSNKRFDSSKFSLLINLDVEHEERGELILLKLSNEIWQKIVIFISVKIVFELRFLNKRFNTISTLCDRLYYYRRISHEILNVEKLYELFVNLYQNVLFSRFRYYFNKPTLFYLRCRMQFMKNQFRCSHILSHMFDCPRSKFCSNNCNYCSRLYIDNQPTFFAHVRTLYILISTKSIFSDSVVQLFEEHSIKCFTLEVAYKSDEHYRGIKFDSERYLKLFVCGSACEIVTMFNELHLRFLYNFMWIASKDFTSGSQRAFFLDSCISFKKEYFPRAMELLCSQQFEIMFLT